MKSAKLILTVMLLGACSKSDPAVDSERLTDICTKKDLLIFFSPMYTAYDGTHEFKIPAIVANVDPNTVTWKASDSSMVAIVNDPGVGGAMITALKAGVVNIAATTPDGQCAQSKLTITAASAADWTAGSMRYNNGIKLTVDVGSRRDAGAPMADVSCTNCHGDTAVAGPYKTVAHTPQQIGGFSDDDLISIFTKGVVPPGGYYDSSIVPYNRWQAFHKWQMSPEEAKGVVVYLRSLTPQSQMGRRGDFGGMGMGGMGGGNPGGGNPPGPNPPGGGGPGPSADAATPEDVASTD